MNKIIFTPILLMLLILPAIAGPPPGAGVNPQPGGKSAQPSVKWFGLEYGWYGPSLKDLNNKFRSLLGTEKIGTNDYLAIGIGMPTPGDNRVGLFFGYWNGSAEQGTNQLKINMIIFSPEFSFRIVKIQDKAFFSLGLIMRDVFSWWTFKGAGIDTTEIPFLTDIGAKVTAEYYPIKTIGLKLDFGRIFVGLDWMDLFEDKIKFQTQGFITKFGVNFYY